MKKFAFGFSVFLFGSLFLFLNGATAQVTSVVSNRSGNIKINDTDLPVSEDSPFQNESKNRAARQNERFSILTEKPAETSAREPAYFCSTANYSARSKGKTDDRAVGSLNCGTLGSTPCYWTKPIIFIGFINGTPELKQIVRQVIAEWTTYANVGFIAKDNAEYSGDTADVKIYFSQDDQYNSFVGVNSYLDFLRKSKDTPTMNLGFIGKTVRNADGTVIDWVGGTILHEFGHVLGLQHEHQNPIGGIRWNRDVVIKNLSGPPNGWSMEVIDNNIFRALSQTKTQFTQYDPSSVMHYGFPASWTQNGIAIPENFQLSETDKNFVAKIYPRRRATLDTNQYYRLTSWNSNKQNCLTIAVPAGGVQQYKPYFLPCDNKSKAQLWKFTAVEGGNYRLTNFLTGSKLALADAGISVYAAMENAGNYGGQIWTITSFGNYYRLTSQSDGIYYSLSNGITAGNTGLFMLRTAHWSNQAWEFMPAV